MPFRPTVASATLVVSISSFGQWSLGGGAVIHAERRDREVYFGPMAQADFRLNERWSTRWAGFWAVPKKSEVEYTSSARSLPVGGDTTHARHRYDLARSNASLDLGCAIRLGNAGWTERKGYAIAGIGASLQRMHTRSRGQRTDLTTGYSSPISYDHTRWLGGLTLFSGYERVTRRGALFFEGHLLLQAERHEPWPSSPAARVKVGCRLRLGRP